jgi:hypothetical protein
MKLLIYSFHTSATAASIARMIIFLIVSNGSFDSNYDLNQTKRAMFYWSMVEEGLGLISSCLPVLSPLLRRIEFPRTLHQPFEKIRTLSFFTKGAGYFSISKMRGEVPEPGISHAKTPEVLNGDWVRLSLEEHGVAEQPRDILDSAT